MADYPQDYPTERILDPPPNKWQQGARPPTPVSNPHFTPLSEMPIPENPVPVSLRPQMGPFLPGMTTNPDVRDTVPLGQAGNPLGGVWSFLASLFGGGRSAQPQGPAQGMRGLLQQPVGRNAPGTDNLGNPYGRF